MLLRRTEYGVRSTIANHISSGLVSSGLVAVHPPAPTSNLLFDSYSNLRHIPFSSATCHSRQVFPSRLTGFAADREPCMSHSLTSKARCPDISDRASCGELARALHCHSLPICSHHFRRTYQLRVCAAKRVLVLTLDAINALMH